MQMDIKLLEAFRAVMDNHSVTGAAKVLGLTQPAVSAQIARLEAQVGFELFERVGGRLKATARGRRFCDEVRTVLDSIDTLASTARNIRSGETETLTVASHPGASISLMPGVIANLLERRPEARLRLINRTSEEVGRIFEAGGADIAIAEWPIHVQGVDLRRFDVPCVAILPQAHPLTAQEVITAEDLAGEPFVAMAETRLIGHRLRSVFSDTGIRLAPVADSEYFSTICGLVAAGCGVAVVDRLSALSFRPMGLAIRRFEPALRYEIGLFRRKTALLSPIAEDLITLIDAAIRSASDESEAPEMETVE